jgi:hypothetical protein
MHMCRHGIPHGVPVAALQPGGGVGARPLTGLVLRGSWDIVTDATSLLLLHSVASCLQAVDDVRDCWQCQPGASSC